MKKCKYCQSEIDSRATVCPVCRRNLGSGCSSAIVLVLIFIFGGIFAYYVYKGTTLFDSNKGSKSQYETGGYSSYQELSFKKIIEAKKENLSNAISLYEGKVFIFEGKIKYIGESYFQIEYEHKGLGYNFDIYWSDSQTSKINKLKNGDRVKFYAEVYDLNPLFGYCTIKKAILI